MEQEEFKGYNVHFDETADIWVAYDKNNDQIAKNVSRKKLLETLDKISKKKFERFDVLKERRSGEFLLCTVTSIVPTGVWITWKESSAGYKKGEREKLTYNIRSLMPVTKHNLETVKKIKELHTNIESIELAISKLEHGMNDMSASMIEKLNEYLSVDNQIQPPE